MIHDFVGFDVSHLKNKTEYIGKFIFAHLLHPGSIPGISIRLIFTIKDSPRQWPNECPIIKPTDRIPSCRKGDLGNDENGY